MNDEEAIVMVKKSFNVNGDEDSPVRRKITCIGNAKRRNVVVVIMEGMSRFNMGKYRGPNNLTPNLDSLKNNSLWFENIFTQGIHTYNGIFSTLFSYPALLKQHPMNKIPTQQFYSMPAILKEK